MLKGKMLFACLALTVVLSLVATSCGGAAPAGPIEWQAQSLFGAADTSTTIQAQGVVDATNEALEGKLHTTLYLPGQIVPAGEMLSALSEGVYDAALLVPMIEAPEGVIAFGLPYGWENIDQVMEFYYDYGLLEVMREIDAEQGIFFAGPLPFGPCTLMGNFPFRTLDDIKGKKVWAEGPTAAFVELCGGKAVWFPPEEVYMGLKLGTIDGVIFGTAELESLKLKEVVDYVNFPSILSVLCVDWIISMDSWNELTPEMQQTYEATMKKAIPQLYAECMVQNDAGIEAAKAIGVEMVYMEPAEVEKVRAVAMAYWDEVANESPKAAQAVQMLRDYLATKGIEVK